MPEQSEKLNDLSGSKFRKQFFDQEFIPETRFAVAMGRVSTKKQKGEAHFSDRAQLEAIELYVQAEELVFVRDPWDVAETASKHENRKAFQQMISFVRASQNTDQPVKHVVFSHQSRSNRNRESARELEALLKIGVTIHFAREKRKLSSQFDLEEFLLWDVNNILNEKFIRDHTKNSVGGMLKRIEIGLMPGKAPFGYRNYRPSQDKQSIFRIEDREAAYVLRAFELFATGRYSEETVRQLVNADFPDIHRKPGKQKFSYMLRNPFYYGDFMWKGETYHGDPAKHPPIMSFTLWNKVQEVLKQPHRSRKKTMQRDLPYLGLMKCGGRILDDQGNETEEVCGCLVTGEEKRKKKSDGTVTVLGNLWHCGSVKRCSQRNGAYMARQGLRLSYRQERVEALFETIFRPLRFTADVVKWMQEMLLQEHRQKSADHKQHVEALQRRHQILQTMISRAYEDKLTGMLPEALWREKNAAWTLEAEKIQHQILALNDEKQGYIEKGVEVIELVQHLETIYKSATPEKKRRMVEIVSSNLILRNGSLEFKRRSVYQRILFSDKFSYCE